HHDLLLRREEADLLQRALVLAAVGVALGGVGLVVERHAGADDVDDRRAAERQAGLDDLAHLLGVAGEGARHEAGAGRERLQADVDGRERVGAGVLEALPEVGGGGELPLGEAVDAVVLDDVDHAHVAPEHVLELAEADGAGVAVAADADGAHAVVGLQRAGAERGHAAVQRVEAVRLAQEVGGRLAGAADARELDDVLRLQVQLVRHLDQLGGHGVVAAPLAERGGGGGVVGLGEADEVELRSAVHAQAPSMRRRASSGRNGMRRSSTQAAVSGMPSRWAMGRMRAANSGSSSRRMAVSCASRFISMSTRSSWRATKSRTSSPIGRARTRMKLVATPAAASWARASSMA